MNRARAVAILLLLPLFGGAPRPSGEAWRRVGEPSGVTIDPQGGLQLSVSDDRSIAGALSTGSVTLSGGAVLVTATVAHAAPGAVTFALIDAESGDSVAHWRTPRAVEAPTQVSTVLEVTNDTPWARLFVGAHGVASTARVTDVRFTPTRRGVDVRPASYGAVVDGDRSAGQVFRATGRKLDAVTFRLRQLGLDQPDGPELRVAVYAWLGPERGRSERPLAERLVPRRMAPPVGAGEIEVTVPFGTSFTPGQPYLLEFSPAGPCKPSAAFLLYCGEDSYPHGFRCENGAPTPDRWDLHLRTFESQ